MRIRIPLLLASLILAIPMFAGVIGNDITVPVVGFVEGPGVEYRTELVITNHRDARQYVSFAFVQDGHDFEFSVFQLEPKETKFLPTAGFATGGGMNPKIGALRIRSKGAPSGNDTGEAQIEANAFIIADRGKFGSSRQEVAGIASDEYLAKEAIFLGVRHSIGTGAYTNVGVVNMYAKPVTFYVRFQYSDPVALTVPPFSLRQIRIPGEGAGGRYVHVYPEWAMTGASPADPTPWVAYASTIDILTGDAYSGMRVPSTTKYLRSDGPVIP